MNARFLSGILLASVLVARTARADDRAACLDAASAGQKLEASHDLVEARRELLACAAAQCPSSVQRDCANRLNEVERALPTVVIAAKDETGADLVGVRVSVDGAPLAPNLDGLAVPMNAGLHAFHFELAGRQSLDLEVTVREGEKNQP